MNTSAHSRGFSLIELLTVLCIAATIFAFAAPSFGSLVARTQVDSKADATFDLLQLARSNAIDRGQYITICPSVDGTQCESSWQQGVMVFVDNNHDRTISHDEEMIAFQAQTGHASLHSNQPYFTYSPMGTLKGRMGSIIACPNQSDEASSIRLLISLMGRVRAQAVPNTATADCESRFQY